MLFKGLHQPQGIQQLLHFKKWFPLAPSFKYCSFFGFSSVSPAPLFFGLGLLILCNAKKCVEVEVSRNILLTYYPKSASPEKLHCT